MSVGVYDKTGLIMHIASSFLELLTPTNHGPPTLDRGNGYSILRTIDPAKMAYLTVFLIGNGGFFPIPVHPEYIHGACC
jgi:hypothetical protein